MDYRKAFGVTPGSRVRLEWIDPSSIGDRTGEAEATDGFARDPRAGVELIRRTYHPAPR